jgi:hypothetical protein
MGPQPYRADGMVGGLPNLKCFFFLFILKNFQSCRAPAKPSVPMAWLQARQSSKLEMFQRKFEFFEFFCF